MKNSIYTLSILILFQSCYSYKTFDLKDYETIKPKKVKIELNNSKKYKGKVLEFKNGTFLIESSKGIIEVKKTEIKKIEERKFSFIRTIVFSTAGTYIIIKLLESILDSALDGVFKGFKFPA
ncbi:hypothetical protein [Polaribacter cellanae]|uniref:Uncharacterized protein n=1 Tax=Polaribacter cellanae TaxID=2818493 RepID=A0A975CN06_9FLAO|nr:hypothetical protein [Polaribacter cellanae]QTE22324.1 hypothetical protein J3359_16185 [Polaribacter cellanae]